MAPSDAAAATAATEDKTVAVVAYLTLIGFIAAIFLHQNRKTQLGAFHLRQVLGMALTGVAGSPSRCSAGSSGSSSPSSCSCSGSWA